MVTRSLRSLALRNIRIAATIYVLLILVGTHWPKLHLGTGMSATDKLMHFIGFGLIVIAFWLAQWFTRWWSLLVAGAVFTIADEISQSAFSYGRVFSFADLAAGLLGVLLGVAIVHAFSPVGGRLARAGRERWLDASASLLARGAPWMIIITGGTLGVLVGGVGLVLIDGNYPQPNPSRAMILGAVLGGFVFGFWCFESGLRREAKLIASQKRCPGCGKRNDGSEETLDSVSCTACGRAFEPGQWEALSIHARDAIVSSIFMPVLCAGLFLIFVLVAIVSSNFLLPRILTASSMAEFITSWRALGFESQGVVDLLIFGLVAACTIRAIRRRVAARIDAQSESCVSCGQSLQGVPQGDEGVGRCPECGSSFRRIETDVSSVQ